MMSAAPHSIVGLPQSPDVLGELLHSLSQPLTGLLCSLELSLEHAAEQQQESVAMALQQTEKVIGLIQLMREYVDAERPGSSAFSTALMPALRNLIEELSSIAAARHVQLHLAGGCTATLAMPEARLRLALQYLIMAVIEAQPEGGKVMLALTNSPAGTVLRTESDGVSRGSSRPTSNTAATLSRAKRAVASRVLETAGASLVCGDGGSGSEAGFVLRIPPRAAVRAACEEGGASPVSTGEAFCGMVDANPDANICRAGPGS